MPLSFVSAVTTYVSGEGFLPLARIEPSGCFVKVAPPFETALEGRRTVQIAESRSDG